MAVDFTQTLACVAAFLDGDKEAITAFATWPAHRIMNQLKLLQCPDFDLVGKNCEQFIEALRNYNDAKPRRGTELYILLKPNEALEANRFDIGNLMLIEEGRRIAGFYSILSGRMLTLFADDRIRRVAFDETGWFFVNACAVIDEIANRLRGHDRNGGEAIKEETFDVTLKIVYKRDGKRESPRLFFGKYKAIATSQHLAYMRVASDIAAGSLLPSCKDIKWAANNNLWELLALEGWAQVPNSFAALRPELT